MSETDPAQSFGLANRITFGALRAVVRVLLFIWFRLTGSCAAPLPRGPVVFAPNHRSLLDPVVVQVVCQRRLVFMITNKWYSRPSLRWFFRFMRCIPVEDGARNRAALDRALTALGAGHSVAIFPEGRISADGRLGEFVPGVVALARRAGVPIVPVGVVGTREALPRGARIPRPCRITVRFGPPIFLGETAPADASDPGDASRRALLRTETARVRAAVANLLPESLGPTEGAPLEQSSNRA